ncbi:hypothetical protein Tco_0099399 [Tanacetum coccineum]
MAWIKHLDWITVRRDDDVLYKFKEGDFHRLRIQDIGKILLLPSSCARKKWDQIYSVEEQHAEYDESNTYVLERINTSAGNPVKKILLKLNLSDHRLCKMVVEVPDSSWLTRSITTCSYPTDKHKVIMKAQNLLKIEMLVWGKLIQKLRQKGVYEESFSRHAAWIGES